MCEECPKGEYQDETGQTQCKPCTDSQHTTSGTGSTQETECYSELI